MQIVRDQVSESDIDFVMKSIRDGLTKRTAKHGSGKFINRAEAMGVLLEEFHELVEAQRDDSIDRFLEEMMDVCISAV